MRPARSARDNMREKKRKKKERGWLIRQQSRPFRMTWYIVLSATVVQYAPRYLHLVRCFAFMSRAYIRKCPSASNLRDTVKFFQFFRQAESAILACCNSPQVKKELSQYLITLFLAPTASNYWKVLNDVSKIICLIVNLHANFCQLWNINFLKSSTISLRQIKVTFIN